MATVVFFVVLAVVGAFFAYVHTHRADGREPAVWDCGRDDCSHRNRNTHYHRD
jgi:hypothetical protein